MTPKVDPILKLLPLWYAEMARAKELIVCTHGIGVDVYRAPDVGGIDFDFDKPDPDMWRLQLFFEKQFNDGALDYSEYRELAENEELLIASIKAALNVE